MLTICRSRKLWAGLAACGLLLAACGSSSPAKTTSRGSPSATVKASVVIGKAVNTIGFTAVDVAIDKGYFSQAGINATSEVLAGSSVALPALVSNSIQFATASSTALLLARSKGLPLEAVASLDSGVPLEVIVSNKFIAKKHLSTSEPLAQRVRKMAGATIGTLSETDKAFWGLLFKYAGVSASQFTEIHESGAAELLAALKRGLIDAFMQSPPAANFAQSQGGSTILATIKELPQTANMAYDLVIVDTHYADAHPAIVREVATAFARADNLMDSDPKAVLPIEEQHYKTYPPSVLLSSLEFIHFPRDGLQNQAMWNEAEAVAKETGALSSAVPDTEGTAWTNRYIDTKALGG